MLNIVIPMAGRGSRFSSAGFALPKPLIDVDGLPMIARVIHNLTPSGDHRFVFLCLQEHLAEYDLERLLQAWAPGSIIVAVEGVTEGAACTVLLARDLIDGADPLMIANSDQWVDVDIDTYLDALEEDQAEGLIMTMTADDPKWSYVRLNSAKQVTEVLEKVVVSNEATVGVYNFREGSEFVRAADAMIVAGERSNGEFYVAPVYNQTLRRGGRVVFRNVGSEGDGMYGLGIPADLEAFLSGSGAERLRRRDRRAAEQ